MQNWAAWVLWRNQLGLGEALTSRRWDAIQVARWRVEASYAECFHGWPKKLHRAPVLHPLAARPTGAPLDVHTQQPAPVRQVDVGAGTRVRTPFLSRHSPQGPRLKGGGASVRLEKLEPLTQRAEESSEIRREPAPASKSTV